MNWTHLVAGAVLLLIGRKFFWLFVGIVGFVTGMQYTALFFPALSEEMVFLISLGIGAAGAMLAVFTQWMVMVVAGFIVGGQSLLLLSSLFMASAEQPLFVFAAGGILGAVVMILTMDFALACLSSLFGAILIVGSLGITETTAASVMIFALTAAGVFIQTNFIDSSDKDR